MSLSYTNYRWERSNARKGDRYYYKRDATTPFGREYEQVIAIVTYDSNSYSLHWGKWHLNIGSQSPALYALKNSDIPKFSSKDDAMAWATAMIGLST
jgi:hypothetical protein